MFAINQLLIGTLTGVKSMDSRTFISRITNIALAMALFLTAGLVLSPPNTLQAAQKTDWPTWRGPNYDGVSQETGWYKGKKIEKLWQASVGTGFSAIVASQDMIYTMGNTAKDKKDEDQNDVVYCFNAKTGKLVWKYSYPCSLAPKLYEGGPNASPTLAGGRVFTVSRQGQVYCFDAKVESVVWSRNLKDEEGIVPPKWGISGSPLIVGDKVILNAGASGIALDIKTGATKWKSLPEGAGYSTPVPFEVDGTKAALLFTAKKIVAVDISNGNVLWEFPWETSWDVNAADPIIKDNTIFISSGYNKGCALLNYTASGADLVWQNKNMRNQCTNSVLLDGYIYGFDGQVKNKGALACIEYKTGKLKWTQKGLGTGTLTAADGKLIILSESGQLVIAKATPEGFQELTKAQILKGRCWTLPTLINGRIYARNAIGDLVCLVSKLKEKKAE